MDPFTALALAGNILQFVDFAAKLIDAGLEVSRFGGTVEHYELQNITGDLASLSRKLSTQPSHVGRTEAVLELSEDSDLQQLAGKCALLADELNDCLSSVIHKKGQSKWKTFRQVLLTLWSEKKIQSISQRLNTYRDQLQFHMVRDLTIKLDHRYVQAEKHATELTQFEQKMSSAILNQKDVFAQVLEGKTDRITTILQKLESSMQIGHLQGLTAPQSGPADSGEGHSPTLVAYRSIEPVQVPGELEEQTNLEQTQGQKEWLREYLASLLAFPQQRARFDDVSQAHQETFRWIFNNTVPDNELKWDNFTAWLESGSGVFWMNGKAGSGKSCLMKYCCLAPDTKDCLSRWLPSRPEIICVNFFLWNSGVHMQKTQIGLLQSIVLDVCEQHSSLVDKLFPDWFQYHLAKTKHEWARSRRVKNFDLEGSIVDKVPPPSQREILEAFRRLRLLNDENYKICLFIDGIDELDGNISHLIDILVEVCGPHLKMVVSSRPIPECIDAFQSCPKLRLQDLTGQDMANYVDDVLGRPLRKYTMINTDQETTARLKSDIVTRSSGVFLWTVLVVDSLISGLRNYDTIDELFLRLDLLPDRLESLYKHMLDTLVPFYREQASKILQIAYVAHLNQGSTLSAIQLHYAMNANLAEAVAGPTNTLSQSVRKLIFVTVEGRLRSRCRGLLEVDEQGNVVFLHRTVRDFLAQPEIWDYTSSLNLDLNFNVNLILLVSCVCALKGEAVDLSTKSDYDLVPAALRFAALYEETGGDARAEYIGAIDALDQAMTHHYERHVSGQNSITAKVGEVAAEQAHWVAAEEMVWSPETAYSTGALCPKFYHTFLSAVLSYGLRRYLIEHLLHRPRAYLIFIDQRQMFRVQNQVLDHILEVLAKTCREKRLASSTGDWLQVLSLFLSLQDFDVNQDDDEIHWTIWKLLLGGRYRLPDETFKEVVDLFIRAGADMNISVRRGTELVSALDILASRPGIGALLIKLRKLGTSQDVSAPIHCHNPDGCGRE